MSAPIDLRSDTVTHPTPEMRSAMALALVGDDVYGEDPSVKELEGLVAQETGKEAAMFVPSGTMGNLVSIMAHADRRFSEVVVGSRAHVSLYEVAGVAAAAHVMPRIVPNKDDGTMDLAALAEAVQEEDIHCATTRAVLLENTNCHCGGRVLPMEYVAQVRALCDQKGIALHCDGARLWHAAHYHGQPLAAVAAPFDSATLCLSKALGAPVGSVVVGRRPFIEQARRARKMLGGGMRQAGLLAAAGVIAVKSRAYRIGEDHRMAGELEGALKARGFATLQRDTNILLWRVPDNAAPRFVDAAEAEGVRLTYMAHNIVRAVPHYGNKGGDMTAAADILARVKSSLGF